MCLHVAMTAAHFSRAKCIINTGHVFMDVLQTFERAMRFSCDEFHIWYQFALSLMCSEKVSGLNAYFILHY